MYLPRDDLQVSLTELSADISPEQALPNVTKGITDVLELCQSAGFDQHGFGCGLSIAFVLMLAAALLLAFVVVVVPAVLGLIVGIITTIGTVITAIVAGITAAILGVFATITALLSLISRTIVKIVSLPFGLCLRNRDPISPLDAPGTSGVVDGQVRYVREVSARPPSYHSSDEDIDPLERRK